MSKTKFVNEGFYGCVYKPYLKCDKKIKKTDNYVGKVFGLGEVGEEHDYRQASSEEIENNRIIEKIDPKSLFTVKYIDICDVDKITDKKLLKEIAKCENFDPRRDGKNPEEVEGKPQLIYEYGGIDLKDLKISTMGLKNFIPLWLNIFKGIILLQNHRSVHQDIKPENILYNPEQNKLNLIDFGWLQKNSEIYKKQSWKRNDFDYAYFPPEYKISFGLLYADEKNLNVKGVKDKYKGYYSKFLKILDKKTNFSKKLKEYEKKLIKMNIEKKRKGDIRKYFTRYSNRVDIFELGITLIEILMMNKKIKGLDTQLGEDFYRFISHLVEPDPSKRYTPKQAYDALKKLCNKYGLSATKKLKYNYMCAVSNNSKKYYKKVNGKWKPINKNEGMMKEMKI